MRCHGWQAAGLLVIAIGLSAGSAAAQQPGSAATGASSSNQSGVWAPLGSPQVQLVSTSPATQRLPQVNADDEGSGSQAVDLDELRSALSQPRPS